MSRAIAALVAVLGVLIGHAGHRLVDANRGTTAEQELLVVPSGAALRVASSGLHVQVADVMWMRTVIEFGAKIQAEDPLWTEWLARSLEAVSELDPLWRTPLFYGGSMLRVAGAEERSTALFKLGSERFPEDPYFPFAVGMNCYFDGDMEQAAEWVAVAAERPGAPGWYGDAAVAFRLKEQSAEQALHYLDEELRVTTDETLRAALLERRAQTLHDVYEEGLNAAARRFEERVGRPPRPEELVSSGLLTELPVDPLGGQWVVDVDGSLRSDKRVEALEARDLALERKMLRSWVEVRLGDER